MSLPSPAALSEVIDGQIQQQGLACIKVDDGHVLVLTTDTLEQLLVHAVSSGSGRVCVLVKAGVTA